MSDGDYLSSNLVSGMKSVFTEGIMDNCKEVLDKILQDTKKKASSKLKVADKNSYEQALHKMLQAEGFSDVTEKYI